LGGIVQIEKRFIGIADAKRLIGTVEENPHVEYFSRTYMALKHTLFTENHRRRKHHDPRYQHTICLDMTGRVIDDVETLFAIISCHEAADVYVCIADDVVREEWMEGEEKDQSMDDFQRDVDAAFGPETTF
jgi:hypothetical protein